jgi:NADP-dependent 3-hydroxy acid dehydrogenase YdfG
METTKIWLVTGASQGLGLLTVKYLLSKDQTVIATTRDKNKFDPAISSNPNLEIISLDLTSEGEVKNSINKIVEKYGRIDVLINNAGHGFVGG